MARGAAPTVEAVAASFAGELQSGTVTPGAEGTRNTKRKQTLLSLLDALQELSKEEGLARQQASFEDDRDVPTVDEHLQKVGAEAFSTFERRILSLDRELRNFANAARQLGSSVGILSSSFYLRERLAYILYLFHENAADLFPRKVHRQSRDPNMNLPRPSTFKRKQKAPAHIAVPTVHDEPDPEEFPDQLELFAKDVIIFLDTLNEFPEFTDEAVNTAITSLEGDLKYWASCLRAYKGQFRYPAVQRYLHDLTTEMGEHLDSITSSLSIFIEIGVPTIRFAQQHAAANLLNLSTVATFFSAVTATTLQFSFDQTDTPLASSVNGFWFTSMVFSIGAAVNSLLGLTWKQAMYRSPGHRVPWWVLIWIKRSPLVFLVLSVACFSMGLVLFAYSSGQHRIVSTVTTVFSACSCFGLTAVSCWFACERWAFNRHKGRKWLADVLSETKVQMYSLPGVFWCIHEPRNAMRKLAFWARHQYGEVRDNVKQSFLNLRDKLRGQPSEIDLESSDLAHASMVQKSPMQSFSPEPPSAGFSPSRPSDSGLFPISEAAPSTVDGHDNGTIISDSTTALVAPLSPDQAAAKAAIRARFAQTIRHVVMMSRSAGGGNFSFPTPERKRTKSSDGTRVRRATEPKGMLKASRVAALVPKLKSLTTTQDLAAHTALVRHLQFSPDGKFLATSSWDRTSVIFRLGDKPGDPFTSHRVLAHPQGFVGQVAWKPSRKEPTILLTKLTSAIKIWTEEGVCRKTINRGQPVQSVTWMPDGEEFLSVENSNIVKLDLNGKVLKNYRFDRMNVHDVAVTQDGSRMLCVGTLTASEDGLQPSRSRAEKQIIVYNLADQKIENRVPVLHEVRDITLAQHDPVALVSYENKAPPQLWKLETIKDSARLSLRHTYMPKAPVDFAGPSYFGGKNDELVLCAGKAGDIHIWDRESAVLLHHVRSQALGGDLTCVAWNHPVDPFMFATGSHDGAVRIWTTPPPGFLGPYQDVPDIQISTSRDSTHPTNTPRASRYEPDFRTESPIGGADSQESGGAPSASGSSHNLTVTI